MSCGKNDWVTEVIIVLVILTAAVFAARAYGADRPLTPEELALPEDRGEDCFRALRFPTNLAETKLRTYELMPDLDKHLLVSDPKVKATRVWLLCALPGQKPRLVGVWMYRCTRLGGC